MATLTESLELNRSILQLELQIAGTLNPMTKASLKAELNRRHNRLIAYCQNMNAHTFERFCILAERAESVQYN